MLDGGLGEACDPGNLAEGMAVEVEEEQFPVVVAEAVDEVVERLVAEVGGLVGEEVVDFLVEFDKLRQAAAFPDFLSGDVEGDADDPCVDVAFALEGGPGFPEGAGDFLVEVAEVVAVAFGKVNAYSHQSAFALAKHLKELGMLACVYLHLVVAVFSRGRCRVGNACRKEAPLYN